MAKLRKLDSWTYVLLLCITVLTTGSQGRKLEERFGILERRISAEGSIRAYDISILHHRLDDVMSVLNTSLAQQCDKDDTEEDTDVKEVREFVKPEVTHWEYKSHVQKLERAFIDQKKIVMGLETKTKNNVQELKRFKSLITDKFSLIRSEQENEMKMLRTEVQILQDKNSVLGKSHDELSAKYDTVTLTVSNLDENEVIRLRKETKDLQKENNVLRTQFETLSARYDDLVSNVTSYYFSFLTFSSCKHALSIGFSESGIYHVRINEEFNRVAVYCDQTTDGGGWLVIQRRQDGTEDFYRNWEDYTEGFGDNRGEFWLGNKYISALTAEQSRELRIDLGDFEGNKVSAKYSSFRLKGKTENFALQINGYSGDAGDSLKLHDGQKFSTKDRDNDASSTGNCAAFYTGAWWYSKCHASNLNGVYYQGKDSPDGKGIVWYHWKNSITYSLKFTEMKVR